ncbi:MAG: 4Fe-4S dicluster domain-containing protein [Candidatus Ranarchaeia archaeon]
MVRRFLYIDPWECTGCRICEMTCSLKYFKVVNPRKARLQVRESSEVLKQPFACRHCEDPPCVPACPNGAIKKLKTGQVIVMPAKCTGVGACVEACPWDIPIITPKNPEDPKDRRANKAILCLLCGACVDACPVGTLRIETNESLVHRRQKKFTEDSKKLYKDKKGKIPGLDSKEKSDLAAGA